MSEEGRVILVACIHCPFRKVVREVGEGVTLLAQHTIAIHPYLAEDSPIVHVWRQKVAGEASFNGHNKVSSEGVFYID